VYDQFVYKTTVRHRVERALFAVMGPAQVGDVNEPLNPIPDRPVDLCPQCHQPRDDHEVVRDARLTWTRCREVRPA
jgi:hypothetical protein